MLVLECREVIGALDTTHGSILVVAEEGVEAEATGEYKLVSCVVIKFDLANESLCFSAKV